jgi:hypothetical protein
MQLCGSPIHPPAVPSAMILRCRHFRPLATFLMQTDPPTFAFGVVVLDAHGDGRADAGEGATPGTAASPRCTATPGARNLAARVQPIRSACERWLRGTREVARRAGVSHNAPYKHFPEKRDLLAAVAASGFEVLAERTLSSLEGLTDARARLLACGRAFVAHGIANPALYRLMFSAALTSPDAGRPPIEKAAAAKRIAWRSV